MYDYGKETNLKKYGSENAPLYPIDRIKDFPIVLICGKTDLLAPPKDYQKLK